jgi:hypothetical protein
MCVAGLSALGGATHFNFWREGQAMAKKIKLMDWTVLGRVIGKASGWDDNGNGIMLYDFVPVKGCLFPEGCLCIDYETGIVESYNDAGDVLTSQDVVAGISSLPIQRKQVA